MQLFRLLLAPFSPLYRAIVRARNRAFDAHPERAAAMQAPVLSLGNLSTGGTGKTPLTLFLAQALQERGMTNVILSRGYGGRRKIDPMDVAPDSDPSATGDEPLMMARCLGPCRVIVGRKRAAAGLRALSRQPAPRLLLLDDGFQHRGLKRDLDILLLDGVRRWGNGRMIPLGDLREPMEEASRAHALVVTRGSRAPKEEIQAWWKRYGSDGPIFWVDFAIGALRNFITGERVSLATGRCTLFDGHSRTSGDSFHASRQPDSPDSTLAPSSLATGRCTLPLYAFCALGHPEAFYADLLLAGCAWVGNKSFRDHQAVTRAMLLAMEREALALEANGLVCTEKDAVKLSAKDAEALRLPLWVAEQRVEGAEPLLEFIMERLKPA